MQINKMAALATTKKNSYIVKKDGAEKIFDSKLGKSTENTILHTVRSTESSKQFFLQ